MITLLLALQVAPCSPCAIRVDGIVALGTDDGPAAISHPTGAALLRDGSWVVTHATDPARIVMFSPDGRYLRAVGRHGDGPGEFNTAMLARIGPGDSVWVFDGSLQRMSVLDNALKYARSFAVPVPGVTDLDVLPDGRMIVAAQIRTEDRAGYPLHLVNADGKLMRSFGTDDPTFRYDRQSASRRSFSPVKGTSTVWVADRNRYRLQLWSIEGTRLREFVRSPRWFPTTENCSIPREIEREPHPPCLIAVQQDSLGVLWTITRISDDNWKAGLGPRQFRVPGTGTTVGITDRNKYFDTIIEALDSRTGRVLATARIDNVLDYFVANRIAMAYHEDAEGNPRIVMWRLQLNQSGG